VNTRDLFAESAAAEALRLEPGITLLRGFARSAELMPLIEAVAAAASFRHLVTPGGQTMSVAMTNCGLLGWVSDRSGYRYSSRDPLTDREEQVLLTIARGRTTAEIARELHISLSTVKTHVASLMAKLGARNRVEVAMWAYETGRASD
jgi:DNA-binding NarL/FixJ family response regulator